MRNKLLYRNRRGIGWALTFFSLALAVIILILQAAVPVRAAVAGDVTAIQWDASVSKPSIQVQIPDDFDLLYIEGTPFYLYKVASFDHETLKLEYTDTFRDIGPDIMGVDTLAGITTLFGSKNSEWMQKAEQLAAAVNHDNTTPDQTRELQNRVTTFDLTQASERDGSSLGLGLYLIEGQSMTEGNRSVSYSPFLACVPSSKDDGGWEYNVLSYQKPADPGETPENPTPTPSVTPGPGPGPSVTPTPGPGPSVTPGPGPGPGPSVTPEPGTTVTPTPEPGTTVTPGPVPNSTETPSVITTPTPDNPGTPGNPSTTGTPGTPTTGDTNHVMRYVGIIIIAAAVFALLIRWYRKNGKSDDVSSE